MLWEILLCANVVSLVEISWFCLICLWYQDCSQQVEESNYSPRFGIWETLPLEPRPVLSSLYNSNIDILVSVQQYYQDDWQAGAYDGWGQVQRAASVQFVEEKNTGVIPIAFLDSKMGRCSENGAIFFPEVPSVRVRVSEHVAVMETFPNKKFPFSSHEGYHTLELVAQRERGISILINVQNLSV